MNVSTTESKVVPFHKQYKKTRENRTERTLQSYFDQFIQEAENYSGNSASAYRTDLNQFFAYLLQSNDYNKYYCADINIDRFIYTGFQDYLKSELKLKNVSVNRKMNTVRTFYKTLPSSELEIDRNTFTVRPLADDSTGSDGLSYQEFLRLIDLIRETEKYNVEMKVALVTLGYATSLRLNAILKLEYTDIHPHPTKKDMYVITPQYLDKSKKIYSEINAHCYELLIQARAHDDRDIDRNRIFTMSTPRVTEMMKRLARLSEGFLQGRKLTFHSLRKGGADLVNKVTNGDMAAVTAQGGWSSGHTPLKSYLKKPANLAGSLVFTDKIDITHEEVQEDLDSMDKKDLIALINKLKNE